MTIADVTFEISMMQLINYLLDGFVFNADKCFYCGILMNGWLGIELCEINLEMIIKSFSFDEL